MSSSSAFLTRELAEQCVNLVRPGAEALIKSEKRAVLYVVVLDPVASQKKAKPVVLWEGAIGEPNKKKWQRDYAQFARAKAALTLRTGMPAHMVLRDFPHLYAEGDFKFGGSEIRNGIIVAASGLDWHFDYMVSGAIAAMCHGLCIRMAEANYAKDTHFIGEKEA